MFKRLARSPLIPYVLGTGIWAYMSILCHTLRWKVEGADIARELWRQDGAFIMAAWHSRIFIMPVIHLKLSKKWGPRPFPISLMVSASRDGEFTNRASRLLGLHVVRGSAKAPGKTKDKRGFLGAKEAMQAMKKGSALCLTVDGPRGPREQVGVGSIKLAQQMNAPILIYGLSAGGKRIDSWDRQLVSPPFAKGAVVFAGPIQASKEMDTEELRQRVEHELRKATARADELAGLGPDSVSASEVGAQSPDAAPTDLPPTNTAPRQVRP
ncbi:MAG: DUF374 domain-containing protein [Hyphomonadaceae bacterium]